MVVSMLFLCVLMGKLMSKLRLHLWIICAGIALVFTFSTSLQAKTPDGKTPSEETVCDDLSGALFGLCNAYCEAHDCGDPNQRSSDRSCSRIQANFVKKSGGKTIPEDCQVEQEQCPCFTVARINENDAGCTEFVNGGIFKEDDFDDTQISYYLNSDGDYFEVYSYEGYGCFGPDGEIPDPNDLDAPSLSIEEANLCWGALVDANATSGQACD